MHNLDWLVARPIAHRGLHDMNHLRWENTLSSFDAAIAGGFAIECDVHLTADGIPVVFHDHKLDRLTGNKGTVSGTKAADITGMKVGKTTDRVPTLESALERVAGRVPLVIELKGIEGEDEGLVQAVGRLLSRYRGDAAIMSFDHWLIRKFSAEAPGVPGGLTAAGRDPESLEKHFSMLAHDIAFTSFFVNEIPNPFTTMMRQILKRPVITWTVREEDQVHNTFAHADQMTFEGFLPAA